MKLKKTPWVKVILDRIDDPRWPTICFITGSQTSKTEGVLLNAFGWCMHIKRKPAIYFGPTKSNVRGISKRRITPLIESVPGIRDGIRTLSDNALLEKIVYGARFGLGWTGSPTEMASHEVFLALVDERDRMKVIANEGDPLVLIRARTATFPGGTVVVASTPTLGRVETERDELSGIDRWAVAAPHDITSPTWRIWQGGTRHEWVVPCPYCNGFFVPRMRLLKWDIKAELGTITETAKLECPHCKSLIIDDHRRAMNTAGFFLAPGQKIRKGLPVGDEPTNQVASFWVSGLASPWVSWGERAHDLEKARREGQAGAEQSQVNTSFGECYSIQGDRPTKHALLASRLPYTRGQVPDGVSVLVAGVDVGAHELWWAVRGFGPGYRSWLIDYGRLEGPTRDPEGVPDVWLDLDHIMTGTWEGGLRVARVGVDSGYAKDAVYTWCRKRRGIYWPMRGGAVMKVDYVQNSIDKHPNTGKPLPGGMVLTTFETTRVKQTIRAKIAEDGPAPDGQGGWSIPMDITDQYLEHMQNEEEVRTPGIQRSAWKRLGANHLWDCEVLTWAVIRIVLRGAPVPERGAPMATRKKRGYRK